MSSTLAAIDTDRKALLALLAEIADADWTKDSRCPGWSVPDVVSHMACTFWLAVDPPNAPDPAGLPNERAADVYVESRRFMTTNRSWPAMSRSACGDSKSSRHCRA